MGGSRIASVLRLWLWEFWRHVVHRDITVRLPQGGHLHCPAWSRLAGLVVATGFSEHDDQLFAMDLLRPGDVFIDVGANIGLYTVLAAQRGASVLALEPTPAAGDTLLGNAHMNGIEGRVRLVRAAAGRTRGEVRFSTDLDTSDHVLSSTEEGKSRTVPMLPLDDFYQQDDLGGEPILVKIDTEGHDLDVLEGSVKLLTEAMPVVLVEIWQGGTAVRSFLSRLGYGFFGYDAGSRALTVYDAGARPDCNLIAIPKSQHDLVTRRVRNAERPPLRPPRAMSRPPITPKC